MSQVEGERLAALERLAGLLTGRHTAHGEILDEKISVNLTVGDSDVLTGIVRSGASEQCQGSHKD